MSTSVQRMKTTVKRHFPALVPLVQALRSKVGRTVEPIENREPMSDVFNRVYDNNYWGNAESCSGNGSDLKQTAVIRVEIPKLIRDLGAKSMLDIPCGDFFWMQECKTGAETYIGADVVPSMIRQLNERYGIANRRFEVLDLTEDATSQGRSRSLPRFARALFRERYSPRDGKSQAKRVDLPADDDVYRARPQYGYRH